MQRGGAVYIITNTHHTVLYTGVTSDLRSRTLQHINEDYPDSFTARYNCKKLVWYELFGSIEEAIAREKQIKNRNRKYKKALIHSMNPEWNDLWKVIREW
jgi:putative endonuclease